MYRFGNLLYYIGIDVRENDVGGRALAFAAAAADLAAVLGDAADEVDGDVDGYDLFMRLRSSLVIILSGSGGGRPPLLAADPIRGEPVAGELGVSLGLLSPLMELRADPIRGVPLLEPESVLDCTLGDLPLAPPCCLLPTAGADPFLSVGCGCGTPDFLLLLLPPLPLLTAADALCSSFLSVSGVDDLDRDSLDGMDAKLDSLLWWILLSPPLLGVLSGVAAEDPPDETEKVAFEAFLALLGLTGTPDVRLGSVDVLVAFPGSMLEILLPLLGNVDEDPPPSSPPLPRKDTNCIMLALLSLPPLCRMCRNWLIMSRWSGSLTPLSFSTTPSWSRPMNSLISLICLRTFSSICGGSLVSVNDARSCRFFWDKSTHLAYDAQKENSSNNKQMPNATIATKSYKNK